MNNAFPTQPTLNRPSTLMPRRMKSMPGEAERESVLSILLLSMFFLALAHLAVKEFFPSPAFWLVGALGIFAGASYWVVGRRDTFGFLLAMFVCAHFAFADNQGGIWSYIVFAVFIVGAILARGPWVTISSVPLSANILVLVFLVHHILGTVLNSYGPLANLQAMVITLAQVMVFYLFASQRVSVASLKRFLAVWFAVMLWVFVMALNQKFQWVISSSPILPQRFRMFDTIATIPAASFQNSELFAEYFCFVFVISLVLLSHLKEMASLGIRIMPPLAAMFISLSSIVMGASRAAVLLAVASAVYLAYLNFILNPSARSISRAVILSGILMLGGLIVFSMGRFFSMDDMIDDFRDLNVSEINAEGVVSGKGINRSFTGAYDLFRRDSWIIGKGYNLPPNNSISLGLGEGGSDYHSLYICMPFFYGWGGTAAYVLLVFGAGIRIYLCYLRNRRLLHCLVPMALALAVIWGVFILDEYKISITRNPNYFLLIWMLLGYTHAVANSLNDVSKKTTSKIKAESPIQRLA